MLFPSHEHAVEDAHLLSALHALTQPPLIQSNPKFPARPIHWSVYRPQAATMLAATHHTTSHMEPDLIVAEACGERGGVVFHIGVRLHWKVDWHHHFRLLLPVDGPALFVPEDGNRAMHFLIGADGALEALQGLPSPDRSGLDAGLERARVALRDHMDRTGRQPAFA